MEHSIPKIADLATSVTMHDSNLSMLYSLMERLQLTMNKAKATSSKMASFHLFLSVRTRKLDLSTIYAYRKD